MNIILARHFKLYKFEVVADMWRYHARERGVGALACPYLPFSSVRYESCMHQSVHVRAYALPMSGDARSMCARVVSAYSDLHASVSIPMVAIAALHNGMQVATLSRCCFSGVMSEPPRPDPRCVHVNGTMHGAPASLEPTPHSREILAQCLPHAMCCARNRSGGRPTTGLKIVWY